MSETLETPNPTFVEEFGGRLRAERQALLHRQALIAILDAHQARDRVDDAATEMVSAILSRLEGQQKYEQDEVDEAMARLEYGTFGLCEGCDRPIPLPRLRAMPTARYCLGCQRRSKPSDMIRGDSQTPHEGRFMRRRVVSASLVLLLVALVASSFGSAQDAETLGKHGNQLFTQQGCYGCHMIEKYGTPIATDLSHIGTKYDRVHLLRWLRDPSAQKPTAHMPKIALSEADAEALGAYLASRR